MKKILILIILTFIFVSCNQDGDYQYVIHMKDGSKVKAWRVKSEGGGLLVLPPWGYGNKYLLSANEYTRADYVGLKNLKKYDDTRKVKCCQDND